ncbi:MAG: PorP/SprF family type IX secretion system membrane protein [Saprospiraceae bacterium]|nr:PorP/SprF family type IX secretion system membrane protein [Saprospiraceae bacterium]
MTFRFRIIQLVLLTIGSGFLYSQDIHFTQFNMAPLTYNPALTGAFYGSVRVGGLYRDQWGSAYNTPSFYLDSPILKGFRKQDWIGVGVSFFSDEAESEYLPFDANTSSLRGTITTGGLLASGAYHFALDKERNTVIALGVQYGTVTKKVGDKFQFEDAILSGMPTQDILPENDQGKNYLDISGGLTITGKTTGQSFYRIGVSAMHINQPRASIIGSGSGTKLPMRIVGYGTYHMDLNEQLMVTPSILFQNLGTASEVAVQGMLGYKIPDQNTVLKAGLGYRLGDAMEVLAGVDYKDLRVGASYDLTLSDLKAPNNAFELAVAYIIRIYKRPKVDPVIFCPRF